MSNIDQIESKRRNLRVSNDNIDPIQDERSEYAGGKVGIDAADVLDERSEYAGGKVSIDVADVHLLSSVNRLRCSVILLGSELLSNAVPTFTSTILSPSPNMLP